jgi:thiamine-monophosphate kinase
VRAVSRRRKAAQTSESPVTTGGLTIGDVGEFGLLDALGLGKRKFRSGWVGPGDDAAVLPAPENPIAVTTDLLAEGVHFRRTTASPREIGYKALAVNLSDLAAMGAKPIAYTIAAAFPPDLELTWVKDLYRGLDEAAKAFGCPLVGGDTSRCATIFLSLTLLGQCARRGAVLRSTAEPGEDLYLSGNTGESAAGLAVLERGEDRADPVFAPLVLRHLRPTPRLGLGRELARRGLATSMIDVSDGLAQDAGHISRMSGVGLRVEAERLPLSAALSAAAARLGLDPLILMLSGGEEYELLFTARPEDRKSVAEAGLLCRTDITRIGTVFEGESVVLLDADGKPIPLKTGTGFDHFRQRT